MRCCLSTLPPKKRSDGEPYLREGNYFNFWPINSGRLLEGGEDAYSRLLSSAFVLKNDNKNMVQVLLIERKTIEG